MNRLIIFLFVLGTVMFFFSMHFIDLSYNMDSSCMDKNIFGIIQSKEQIYFKGYFGIFLSFAVFLTYFWYSLK